MINIDDAINYPVQFEITLKLPVLPTHILNLTVCALIMMLRNINPSKLCNGVRLQVKTSNLYLLLGFPLHPQIISLNSREAVSCQSSFAIAINKDQGQTLKAAGVNLKES